MCNDRKKCLPSQIKLEKKFKVSNFCHNNKKKITEKNTIMLHFCICFFKNHYYYTTSYIIIDCNKYVF